MCQSMTHQVLLFFKRSTFSRTALQLELSPSHSPLQKEWMLLFTGLCEGPEQLWRPKKKLYKQKWQYNYGQKPFQHLTIISNDTERPRNPRREENVRIIIMILGEWRKGGTDHFYSPQEQHWSLLHLRTLGVLPHIDLKGTTDDPCRH